MCTIHITYAAHIIGGDVTYECISSDPNAETTTFRINFDMYRDGAGGGAQFDNPARFGLFREVSQGNWQVENVLLVDITSITEIDFSDPCVQFPPELMVEKGVYTFEITIPWTQDVFKIAYQRCCRNATISNIEAPESTGAVFDIDLTPEAVMNCNNSPVFKDFPPLVICINKDINFDSGATDKDGDSIVYELCLPYTAGGTDGATTPGDPNSCTGVTPDPSMCIPPFDRIVYKTPTYAFDNPLGDGTDVRINSETGLLNGVPNALGQYVIGICIREFRDGKEISYVRRDFQFNVAQCIAPSSEVTDQICNGDTIIINDEIYTSTGIYFQTLQTSDGCDSTIMITLIPEDMVTVDVEGEICPGGSIQIFDETYTMAGQFTQMRPSTNGCDSLINITITELRSSSEDMVVELCEGESIEIDGEVYDTTDDYTITLTNAVGCDSIIELSLTVGEITEGTLEAAICEGDSIEVFGEVYNQAGAYSYTLENGNAIGCDSIIEITITESQSTVGSVGFDLCDGDVIEVNGVVYDMTGVFEQILVNAAGCDSVLTITIDEFMATEGETFLSICDGSVLLNGETYDQPGTYTQELTAASGCDSILIVNIGDCNEWIYYDFEDCKAIKDHSMDYSEFVPEYLEAATCGSIDASNVYRDNPQENKHSCTEGNNNTTTMCISALDSCDIDFNSDQVIKIDIVVSPEGGNSMAIAAVEFFHRSPTEFDWIDGASGVNNPATKFGVQLIKDGEVIYEEIDIATNNRWNKYEMSASGLNLFVEEEATYQLRVLPYCLEGIDTHVAAWDIDDVTVKGSCIEKQNRLIVGRVIDIQPHITPVIAVFSDKNGNVLAEHEVSSEGLFKMGQVPTGEDVYVQLMADDQWNKNVTTSDVGLLTTKILGLYEFKSDLEYIAADVNNDNRLSVTDVTLMRQLLLGVTDEVPSNRSWKYLNVEHVRSTSDWKEVSERVKIPASAGVHQMLFLEVKVGDVNGR